MPKQISEGAFTERTRIELDPAEQEPAGYDEEPEEQPIDRLTEDEPTYITTASGELVTVHGVDADQRRWPRPFALIRTTDHTGVSGTGVIAHGVQFFDNSVVLHWGGAYSSTVVWKCLEDMLAVHGHDGATQVAWL